MRTEQKYEFATPFKDDLLTYLVVSRSEGPPHTVHLSEYNGNGQCDCMGFRCHQEPLLKQGAFPKPWLECWHIKQAKKQFCQDMIEHIRRTRGEKPFNHHQPQGP